MIKKFLFWCEFPERIDFIKLNSFFKKNNFKADIGIVCKSRKDYENKKKIIFKLSNMNLVRVWPVLSKEEGYWFSSYSSKKSIDSLYQWEGLDIKLDIEPPIVDSNYKFWFIKHLLIKGKNRKYFEDKIKKLSKNTGIMLSSFPFPKFILKRWGMVYDKKLNYNYMFYSSFIPKFLSVFYRFYMGFFIKSKLKFKKETYFAVGLLTPGIFKNEPCYSTPKELDKDMNFLIKKGVKNCVVFRLGSFQELENPEEWLEVIKKNIYKG